MGSGINKASTLLLFHSSLSIYISNSCSLSIHPDSSIKIFRLGTTTKKRVRLSEIMDLHFFTGINSILYLIQSKGMDDRCILFAVYEWYCSMCFSLRTVAFITITYKCWSIGSNALQLWFPLTAFVKSLNSVFPSKSLPAFYLENAVLRYLRRFYKLKPDYIL